MELQITANLILPRPSFCCFKLPIDLSPTVTTLPPSSSLNSQSASTPNTMTFTKSNETVPPTIYNLQAHLHPLRISPVFPFCDTVIPPPFPLKIPQYLPQNTQGLHHCRPREQVWLSVFPFSAAMTSVQVSRRCIT